MPTGTPRRRLLLRGLAALVLCLGLAPWPAAAQDTTLRAETRCQGELICVSGLDKGQRVEIWAESFTDAAITLAVTVTENGAADQARSKRTVFTAPQRVRLFDLPIPADRNWSVAWVYTVQFGDTPAAHDNSVVYRLPYAPGSGYPVIQGYNGQTSHYGAMRFAIDWAMPPGTAIHVARGGVVVAVHEAAETGGPEAGYRGTENFVWIRHDDGTIGHYLHLQKDGALVAPGQTVTAGEVIGLSGNTGQSTEPHLHFHVSTPSNGTDAFKTFPLRFETTGGQVIKFAVGRTYTAP